MTEPVLPETTGDQDPLRRSGSSTAVDFQQGSVKTHLVRLACEIAGIAKRYRKIHGTLFGLSVHRALHPNSTDFTALEIELDSIEAESKHIQYAIVEVKPERQTTIIWIHDALQQYAKTIFDVALTLKLICQNLRRESEGDVDLANYSSGQLQHDKVAYDAHVQELHRWGTRLTELFERI